MDKGTIFIPAPAPHHCYLCIISTERPRNTLRGFLGKMLFSKIGFELWNKLYIHSCHLKKKKKFKSYTKKTQALSISTRCIVHKKNSKLKCHIKQFKQYNFSSRVESYSNAKIFLLVYLFVCFYVLRFSKIKFRHLHLIIYLYYCSRTFFSFKNSLTCFYFFYFFDILTQRF